jgi:flagellum-specific peptidoglycan hydrolase FlgJ
MKRIVIIIFLGILIASCGARRKSNLSQANSKKLGVISEKSNKSNNEVKSLVINTPLQYISFFKAVAINEMQLYGIPASITLAQGILESGSGKGRLARQANNHFGIKCHKWNGDKIYHDDDKEQECFRKYNDPNSSYRDHSEFLANKKRYSKLFKLKITDYKGWAKGLRKAGYATDPKYPKKLISIIERYELYKYDKKPKKKYTENKKSSQIIVKRHIVQKGDTLYSISKLYNTTVDKIKKQNNLNSIVLSIGQKLKISTY